MKRKTNGGNKNESKNNVKGKKCYHGGKLGHFTKDCHKKKNDSMKRGLMIGVLLSL